VRTARLDRLLQRLHRLEDRVLALLLAGMVILAAAQILTRNLFGTGLGALAAVARSRRRRDI
jgi:TRAP-type C4-dicarboxylate transport system permease small subunit